MNPLLLHTPGEPAGIGAELLVQLAQTATNGCRLAIADPALLQRAAELLQLPLQLKPWQGHRSARSEAGELFCLETPLARLPAFGEPDPANAPALLRSLDRAVELAREPAAAIVTGPLNKAVINQAGIAFSGHTEYLAAACGQAAPVMMLVAGDLRVALATTHLPLREVADALNHDGLRYTLTTLGRELRQRFALNRPRIAVCGLNPHAGENGHLGREEIELIQPVMQSLQNEPGMQLSGPWPADTIFTRERLQHCDAVLAMYHDQGLPTLKHAGFGRAVNVTLGLPIIRCSVDHGTALDIAGQGRADVGSLRAAEALALQMASANG